MPDAAFGAGCGDGFAVAVPEGDGEADGGLEGVDGVFFSVGALPAHADAEFWVLAADFAAQFLLAGSVVGEDGFELGGFQQGVAFDDGDGCGKLAWQGALEFEVADFGVQPEKADEFEVLLEVQVVEFLEGFGGVEGALVGELELGELDFSEFVEFADLGFFVPEAQEALAHEFLLGMADHDAVAQGVELLEEIAFLGAHGPVVRFFVLLGDALGEAGEACDGEGDSGGDGLSGAVGDEGVGEFAGEGGVFPESGKLGDVGGFGVGEARFVERGVEQQADAVQIRQAERGFAGAELAGDGEPFGGVA